MTRTRDKIMRMLDEKRAVIQSFGVRQLALFGSYASGEPDEASDLDFVVVFERKSFDAYMDLKLFLEDLFGCPVDLVLADAIKPRLRPTILREMIHAPGL